MTRLFLDTNIVIDLLDKREQAWQSTLSRWTLRPTG